MFRLRKRIGVMAVVSVMLAMFCVGRADGQTRQSPINAARSNSLLRPGLSVGQAAFNIATIGQALSFVPPHALGFHPSPQVAVNPGVGTGLTYS